MKSLHKVFLKFQVQENSKVENCDFQNSTSTDMNVASVSIFFSHHYSGRAVSEKKLFVF